MRLRTKSSRLCGLRFLIFSFTFRRDFEHFKIESIPVDSPSTLRSKTRQGHRNTLPSCRSHRLIIHACSRCGTSVEPWFLGGTDLIPHMGHGVQLSSGLPPTSPLNMAIRGLPVNQGQVGSLFLTPAGFPTSLWLPSSQACASLALLVETSPWYPCGFAPSFPSGLCSNITCPRRPP